MYEMKPNEINIELTNVCSMACSFCPLSSISRPNGFMAKDIFYKTVNEIIEKDYTNLVLPFLMGESLLHKKWYEYISYLTNKCSEKKIETSLVTNGLQLSNENIEKLSSTKLNSIYISCQQFNEAGYKDRNIKQNISYERYLFQVFNAALNLSKDINKKISIYYLNTTNKLAKKILGDGYIDSKLKAKRILEDWHNKLSSWDIKVNNFKSDIELNNNSEVEVFLRDNLSIIFKSFTTWGDYLSEKKFKSNNKNKIYKDISCSHIDGKTLAVFWDGQIGICCEDYDAEINLGNIKEISLSDAFNSAKYKLIHEKFMKGIPVLNKCKNCLNLT